MAKYIIVLLFLVSQNSLAKRISLLSGGHLDLPVGWNSTDSTLLSRRMTVLSYKTTSLTGNLDTEFTPLHGKSLQENLKNKCESTRSFLSNTKMKAISQFRNNSCSIQWKKNGTFATTVLKVSPKSNKQIIVLDILFLQWSAAEKQLVTTAMALEKVFLGE